VTTTTRFAINALLTSTTFSALLFVCAGTLAYPQGWLYLLTTVVTSVMNVLGLRIGPELMKERMKPGVGVQTWDKIVLGLSAVFFLITIVLAGLDSGRYHWSPAQPWILYGAGVVLTLAGQYLFLTARNENAFFSTVVRIQTERGHTVCESGPYRIVRHPGYAGMILSTMGLPLILGSLWSALPTFCSIGMLITRTFLEDEVLKRELHGYNEYALRTRFRLVPSIW
jgi:protein-S-isoprenylcysteine O-methyltransferase Ste14